MIIKEMPKYLFFSIPLRLIVGIGLLVLSSNLRIRTEMDVKFPEETEYPDEQ